MHFKDWSIRFKITVPLFVIMILGGGWFTSSLIHTYDEIMSDALPEERALNGIRRASFELIHEYHALIITQNNSRLRNIEELKEEIEAYEEVFAVTAATEKNEAYLIEAIEITEQEMKRIGDETVAARLQLLDHIEKMEEFDASLVTAQGNAPNSAVLTKDGHFAEANMLAGKYISELREYVLGPNERTQREIAEIERSLKEILRDHQGAIFKPFRRLLKAGRETNFLTDAFYTKFEALETAEDDLLTVLDEARIVVALETDKAFGTGFSKVAGIVLALLVVVAFFGYMVAQEIAGPVSLLANAVDQLSSGNLSARADVRSKDEIGDLATAFNRMASNLESNIERRVQVED